MRAPQSPIFSQEKQTYVPHAILSWETGVGGKESGFKNTQGKYRVWQIIAPSFQISRVSNGTSSEFIKVFTRKRKKSFYCEGVISRICGTKGLVSLF
jgi:hypothetical protein